MPACVFKKTTIYKLYEPVVDPVNLDLLHLSLHDTKVENLSVDKRFQCLQYTFCEAQHNPVHKCQFVPLIKSIHKKECVHSDIRSVNLIFSGNGKDAWIIDLTSQIRCQHAIQTISIISIYWNVTHLQEQTVQGRKFMTGIVLVLL